MSDNAVSNASDYADRHLNPVMPDGHRAPAGGGVDCRDPESADEVECVVKVGSESLDIVETVSLRCRADQHCLGDCCKITGRKPTFVKYIHATEAEMKKFSDEACERQKHRAEVCLLPCSNPLTRIQCSAYWMVTSQCEVP